MNSVPRMILMVVALAVVSALLVAVAIQPATHTGTGDTNHTDSAAQQPANPLESLGRVSFEPVNEMSGIVRSRTYDDVWWVHNDSGDSPRLFAIDSRNRVIFPTWQRDRFHGEQPGAATSQWPGHAVSLADNYDWEDIALHDGRLWISDLGNNGNARRDLGIYVVNEPNPRATDRMRTLTWLPVRYPDQHRFPAENWHFDCESLAIDPVTGTPYMITKHRMPNQIRVPQIGANLYRLDTRHTDRDNVLARVDSRPDILFATAADFSPDGRWLAVASPIAIWLFERPADGDRWLSQGTAWRFTLSPARTKQAEAICFDDNDTLRLTNEQRDVFRVRRSAFTRVQ